MKTAVQWGFLIALGSVALWCLTNLGEAQYTIAQTHHGTIRLDQRTGRAHLLKAVVSDEHRDATGQVIISRQVTWFWEAIGSNE